MALIPTNMHNMFWKPRLRRHVVELFDDRCAIFFKRLLMNILPLYS